MKTKKTLTPYEIRKSQVQMAYTYMDYHLTLLHEALQKGDKKNVKFQKEQLEKIREKLYELWYFR